MLRGPMASLRAEAVTFDCWNTLLYEVDPSLAHIRRVEALARAASRPGAIVEPEAAHAALERAWLRHIALWQEGVCSGAREVAAWSLGALGAGEEGAPELARAFAEAALETRIEPLEGAGLTLEGLAAAGVRRALICDTGFSPGRVVRHLLERAGLLRWLEVLVFSDEQGVPKPHRRMFESALAPLRVAPGAAVHVGDLRRTDVAGARGAGLRTVRIRHLHDDQTDLAEADWVAESHAHLRELLGLGGSGPARGIPQLRSS